MTPRKKTTATMTYPDHWTVSTETTINGRRVTPGTELRIAGVRGRFRFVKHVRTPNHEWVDVVGGKNNLSRSFNVTQVRTVHRLTKMRAAG